MIGSGALPLRRNTTSPASRYPKAKASVNIISCAAVSFKVFVENNIERKKTMRSILEEFAYGNVSPDPRFFRRNSRYGEAMNAVASNEEKLLAILDGDTKTLFEKFVDAQGEVNQLTAVDNLVYGYKLGMVMTAEAFITSGELIAGEDGD